MSLITGHVSDDGDTSGGDEVWDYLWGCTPNEQTFLLTNCLTINNANVYPGQAVLGLIDMATVRIFCRYDFLIKMSHDGVKMSAKFFFIS